jgi:hypothetical protein
MAAPVYMNSATDVPPDQLRKLEALASLPSELGIEAGNKSTLKATVEGALAECAAVVAQVQDIVNRAGPNLEVPDPDPAQARLNLQLALNRLVGDEATQVLARTDGKAFQTLYNLTNDQMLTLCRLAVDVGAYQKTDDLNEYMTKFNKLSSVVKSLSPGTLKKLGLGTDDLDGLIGSCSCCCP